MFDTLIKLVILTVFFYRSSAYDNNPYWPYYHLAPAFGWMNDPNGFSFFRNEYHLFYQYNPLSSKNPGIAHWAHAKSSDMFHWDHLPIAMYPDQDYDKSGVFSGSAIIQNGIMYILYTGNVNHPGQNPDHNNRQALAASRNGIHVTKYPGNPVIMGDEYQPNMRDPKVWKYRDTFYMVLGNSFVDENETGRILLFSSKNLTSWKFESIIEQSDGNMGYMWECPDLFQLDGKWILLFSPQGIAPQGDMYNNLYQVGYFVGDFDYKTLKFSVTSGFQELDHGHDFYATQTMLDKSGRRIVIAWADMWENNYPEGDYGWTGQMTMPRVLRLTSDQRLTQQPVAEIQKLRTRILYSGKTPKGTINIPNNVGEIVVTAPKTKDFELILEIGAGNASYVTITYDYTLGRITLDRGSSYRRTIWRPKGDLKMQIFIDRSSIEVFCGEGEVTFTSRFFPNKDVNVRLGDGSTPSQLTIYALKHAIQYPTTT